MTVKRRIRGPRFPASAGAHLDQNKDRTSCTVHDTLERWRLTACQRFQFVHPADDLFQEVGYCPLIQALGLPMCLSAFGVLTRIACLTERSYVSRC
jgi:hypothetical protein